MKVNLAKPSIEDLPDMIAETPDPINANEEKLTTNSPLAPAETTNQPVSPAPAEKPAVVPDLPPPAPPQQDTNENAREVTLKERLEELLNRADTLKMLTAELLKELKPLVKEVVKLEKSATDSAELRDARTKLKAAEAEAARFKNAMKLLVNGDKF